MGREEATAAIAATVLPKMTPPTSEELGMADSVYVDELGDTEIVVFRVGDKESRVSTIVIRGVTDDNEQCQCV